MSPREVRPGSRDRSDPVRLTELDDPGLDEQRIEGWLWFLVALGIGLRVLLYLLRQPLFTDEAKLATSLLDRGYAGLLEPLAYQQIAPFLFMWIQETVTVVFGFSEYSLRLVPVVCACASVLLMRHVTRRLFAGTPAIFSLALFAVSYYPVRHGAELKPYATDLLASLVLTALAVEWLRQPDRPRWLWLLAAAGPLAISVSYTAALVAAGVLTALAIPVWRRRAWPNVLAWTACTLLAGAAFALSYYLAGADQYQLRTVAQLPMDGGFPPPGDPLGVLGWLVAAHTGRTFGYPIGGQGGGSLLTFAAFVAGAAVLFRTRRRSLLAILLCPFAFGLAAAMLQRYPYGGSGRVSQYLVPAICLLAGLGTARLTAAKSSAVRRRGRQGVLVFLVLFGVLLAAWSMIRPYRDRPDMVGRDFARWFWDVKSRDAELVCAWEDLRLELARPPAQWAPGGAGYRVNQHIYSRRLRRGEAPDLARVSRQHPLRVVFLGSAVSRHRRALRDWTYEMQTRYELAGREQYRLGGFEQQHGRAEWIELYTFVPHRVPDPLLDACASRATSRHGDAGVTWSQSSQPPAGAADFADCRSITGWAHDPDTALPTLVEVYKAGISDPIGTVCADLLRPELTPPGKLHGFHLWTPEELKTGRAEAFQVLAWDLGTGGSLVAPRQPLFRSQQSLNCPAIAGSAPAPRGPGD